MPWYAPDHAPLLTPAGLMPLAGHLPSGTTREYIPGGEAGTSATIYRMQQLVELGRRDPTVFAVTGRALSPCPQKDFPCYARAIYDWFMRNIKYVYDPNDVEKIEHPRYTLTESMAGDCDSMAVALAAMYESIDLPARFVTVKADMTAPNEYSHVFVEVQVPGQGWTGADVTMPTKQFGWVPPRKFFRREWPATLSRAQGPREDRLEGFRAGNNAMHVCSSCLGELIMPTPGTTLQVPTPFGHSVSFPLPPTPSQAAAFERGAYTGYGSASSAYEAALAERASRTNRMLLWGAVGLGALFLFTRKR